MSTLSKNIRGSLLDCDGWATLPIARVALPHVRYRSPGSGPDAPLLIDDQGVPAGDFVLGLPAANIRSNRVKAVSGVKVINPLHDYTQTDRYLPNDISSTGWDGFDAARPASAQAMGTENVLSSGELDTISADNASSITFAAGSPDYPGHHIRFAVLGDPPGDITQIVVTAKGYGQGNTSGNFYGLYIWNDNGSTWELLDSHTSAVKATLTDTVTSSITDYIHNIAGTNYIDILVMGAQGIGAQVGNVFTYYAALVVSVVPALLAAYVEIEIAGLAGDLAHFNGSEICYLAITSVPSPLAADRYVAVDVVQNAGGGGPTGPQLNWRNTVSKWSMSVADSPGCRKNWTKAGTVEDPEGAYTENVCNAVTCSDANTCTDSAGATCRVRWAGATWP